MDKGVIALRWRVGRNKAGQWNIYAEGGDDVSPAFVDDDCYAMDRDVCEHIVKIHNANLADDCAALLGDGWSETTTFAMHGVREFRRDGMIRVVRVAEG